MGKGSLDVFELELRAAETRLTLDIKNHELGAALEQLLENGEQKSNPPALAMALGWKTFAIHLSQRDRIKKAKDAGDLAIKYASALDPREPRLLAEAFVLGATLRLATPYRTEEDIIEMVAYLDSSFELFAPQPSIDAFDPLLARAMQLRATAGALAASDDFKPFIGRGTDTHLPNGENLAEAFQRAEARSDVEQQLTWAEARAPHCTQSYVWEERKPPSYPRRAMQRIYTGAVLIGYDMSETGVARTIILADADEAGFGEAAAKAMQNWKLAQTVPPECRRNHLMTFTFVIKQS
jgi:TonB family protein